MTCSVWDTEFHDGGLVLHNIGQSSVLKELKVTNECSVYTAYWYLPLEEILVITHPYLFSAKKKTPYFNKSG